MLKWGILLLVPLPFQLLTGVDHKSYFLSTVLVISQWVFLFTAFEAIKVSNDSLDRSFSTILKLNFFLLLIDLATLPFAGLRQFP